jgi:hypothetical protein
VIARKTPRCAFLAFLFFAASVLTACGSSTAPPANLYSANGLGALSVARFPHPQRPDRRASWFSPNIKKSPNLLFVSDAGTGDVYLYTIPSLKVAARVTGFAQPQGECSDTHGNVWVTDASAKIIYELSHEGYLENTLSDADGYPVGCAWDARTGNLAVMNLFGLASAAGNVLVYPYGSGTPVEFTNPDQYLYYFGDFDTKGDLFFDGSTANGKFILSELVKSSTVRTISVTGGTIYYPGMVQWSGSDLIVGDQSCGNSNRSCLYQLSVEKNTAAIKNRIALDGSGRKPVCDLVQGVVINGSNVGGSDNDFCGHGSTGTYLWRYPGGRSPIDKTLKVDSLPVGAALSTVRPPASGQPARARSWMQPGVSGADLLYISDGNGEVAVYRYWQRTLVGLLTDFKKPLGLCADAKGEVFITDYGAQTILGYAHGATKPFVTISDAPYDPYDCAVDPMTGNLAVANVGTGSSGAGNIAVYANAGGQPTYYTDSRLSVFQSCAYDAGGNLLVTNGKLPKYSIGSLFAWLPKGGSRLIDLDVPGPQPSYDWRGVQGLQWDGKYFVIDDYDELFRIAFLKGQAYYVGATYLDIDGPSLYWIYNNTKNGQGTQVVGASDNSNYSSVLYFDYPAGGDAIHYISHGIDSPYGLTVSLKR